MSKVRKVVLAYSGGLDTSVAVAWLREQYGAEVITLTVDVGGGVAAAPGGTGAAGSPGPPTTCTSRPSPWTAS